MNDTLSDKLETEVRNPSIALRQIIEELTYIDRQNKQNTFSNELHCNGLGLRTFPIPFGKTGERIFKEFVPTVKNVAMLRDQLQRPEDHPHDHVREFPFARMVNLLNALNGAKALGIEIPVKGVSNVLTKEQFENVMLKAADKEMSALGKVGVADARVDEGKYRGYVNNLVTAYARGVDASQYVTIMADTLNKKGPESEPTDIKSMREALARTLHSASQAITRTHDYAQTH